MIIMIQIRVYMVYIHNIHEVISMITLSDRFTVDDCKRGIQRGTLCKLSKIFPSIQDSTRPRS